MNIMHWSYLSRVYLTVELAPWAAAILHAARLESHSWAPIASRLFKTELTEVNPGFVNLVGLVEFAWTLKRTLKLSRQAIRGVVAHVIGTPNVTFERSATVAQAIYLCERKAIDRKRSVLAALC